MPLPNFLIIGAAKCGTTSLQSYLAQHPDIFFSRYKEPNYFAFAGETLPKKGPVSPELMMELIYFHSLTNLDDYEKQFEGHAGQRGIGDASVRYLYSERAPERIEKLIPEARMVAILREPVSRLYSHYCMNKQFQVEPLDLTEAIAAEPERIADGWGWDWHYVAIGRYCRQLKHYFERFGRQQLKVFLYDDFRTDPVGVVREICRHIGVSDAFSPDIAKRGKVAYRARSRALDRWLQRKNRSRALLESFMSFRVKTKLRSILQRLNSAPAPKLDRDVRVQLESLFIEEAEELSDLLERKVDWYSNR